MYLTQIKDIYAGKPDAKDEINTEGYDQFLRSFIVPRNFDINSLINDTFCFISGYKGIGKTALLYYLDEYIKNDDCSTCSSFVFFKGDYSDIKKQEMESISKRLVSFISISDDVVIDGSDFEYIWRWLFYRRIWEDNIECKFGLFVTDETWEKFAKGISKISCITTKRKLSIPQKLKFRIPFTDPGSGITMTPETELDFTSLKSAETNAYRQFVKIIDELDMLFPQLVRSSKPYYIFVDELEAYYGDEAIFKRDLKLIRDLIFTVKKLNSLMSGFKTGKTKIICSIRTEILNAINRFIVTKELNKVTSGFDIPLVWDYTNTNSFEHPILKILSKRISNAESENGYDLTERELILKWFPEKIHDIEAANFILNNSWCKPRDIVRLILSAKACLCSTNSSFNQTTFDMLQKRYSIESLNEIREEMRALYSPDQINTIITCLTGFRVAFSMTDIAARVSQYFRGSILEENLSNVLMDLYRLGLIGNFSRASKSYRWQHKGDDGLIISDEWSMMVHYALQSALSVSNRHDRGINKAVYYNLKAGDIVQIIVERIVPGYVLTNFEKDGHKYYGSIHISQLSNEYVDDIFNFIKEGETLSAQVLNYDDLHKKWRLTLKY
ncbi:P-loop ATPase, Sll1717 family [Lacrimispora xylanolytica]|uniref:S1 motif domain-containing protein n=1 Tax=Lacrimispora xylanolytica TaxID=29375 RepID=A0ABY7A6J9_9FIRM|nr:hypothetical protein [Lacrimispora xylanolytica]WAJ22084.1 hypothetical protein OW255_10865 [Lacrimispora xylanolytica]